MWVIRSLAGYYLRTPVPGLFNMPKHWVGEIEDDCLFNNEMDADLMQYELMKHNPRFPLAVIPVTICGECGDVKEQMKGNDDG